MNVRRACGAAALVAALLVSGASSARADGGLSGKDGTSSGSSTASSGRGGSSGSGSGTSSGSSGSGSGSSGTGSAGSGSGSGSTGSGSSGGGPNQATIPDDNDDRTPTTVASDPRSPSSPSTVLPIPASPESTSVPSTGAGPKPTVAPSPSASKTTRQFTRTTTCGSQTLRVDVRVDDPGLRVRTKIDRSSNTWRAVIMQDRRVAWAGIARKGSVDRTINDLPGPETLTVRLTDASGVVCAADLQLPS